MDVDTRNKVLFLMKESCPLRTVLRPKKPCPYFGPSVSCRDCTYDWLTIADEVGKLVRARRASYEVERKRARDWQNKFELIEPVVRKMVECFQILDGFCRSGLFNVEGDDSEQKKE